MAPLSSSIVMGSVEVRTAPARAEAITTNRQAPSMASGARAPGCQQHLQDGELEGHCRGHHQEQDKVQMALNGPERLHHIGAIAHQEVQGGWHQGPPGKGQACQKSSAEPATAGATTFCSLRVRPGSTVKPS